MDVKLQYFKFSKHTVFYLYLWNFLLLVNIPQNVFPFIPHDVLHKADQLAHLHSRKCELLKFLGVSTERKAVIVQACPFYWVFNI